jgi:hypothetical protein
MRTALEVTCRTGKPESAIAFARIASIGLTMLVVASALWAQDMVPFVIPASQPAKSLVALSSDAIAQNADSRVTVRGGHFCMSDGRFRVWGVNMCFGANFPTRADAGPVAARLAAFGVNCVRFHHMDSQPFPNGIWDPKDNMKLSAEALDRLDYFIDQLASRGIYANINLHVSRNHAVALKLPPSRREGHGDKIIDLFTPDLIDAQKRYARELLGHTNPYRKCRYADDEAIAFVEINNEDSFFMWGADQTLQGLPTFYADILRAKYDAWLTNKYGATDKLRAAWDKGAQPLGETIVKDGDFGEFAKPASPWRLEVHSPAAASAKALDGGGLRVEIAKISQTSWHLQLNCSGLTVKTGQFYTIAFKARADKPRQISVGLAQDHQPWQGLGQGKVFDLTADWQTFDMGILCGADEGNARLGFIIGQSESAIEIKDVSLCPGGIMGLSKDESLDQANVALFGHSESQPRMLDRLEFLATAEKAYFDQMRALVKEELGAKALVTGTIVFGPLGLYAQSAMDYIDGHAYWQHPRFPGRPWDPVNWEVPSLSMAADYGNGDNPAGCTLPHLAAQRLADKPYTVSEYNHPAPNDYQAQCVPMIASFAAAQDWDGVWLFAYSHATDKWQTDCYGSFFEIQGNPAKWAFMPAGAGIFRDGGIGPVPLSRTFALTGLQTSTGRAIDLAPLAQLQSAHGHDMFKACAASVTPAQITTSPETQPGKAVLPDFTWRNLLTTCMYVSLDKPSTTNLGSDPKSSVLAWTTDRDAKSGLFTAAGAGGFAWVGDAALGAPKDFQLLVEEPSAAAVTMAALDKLPLEKSTRILITACGLCRNTDMKFTADHKSVGRDWGKGPVLVQPVKGAAILPGGNWTCQAIGPDGAATAAVAVEKNNDGKPTAQFGPQYKTVWYLLTRE